MTHQTHQLTHVLAATDFSGNASAAVDQAAAVARGQDARLTILHVDTGHEKDPPSKLANHVGELDDLTVDTVVRQGHADEVIVAVAAEVGADLIVTGTQGRTGIARFFLGSVAEKVVRMAQTNVLVARGSNGPEGLFERILVPTDFSDASEKALHLAMLMAAPGATVELFHAWQYPPGTVARGIPDDEHNPLNALQREIVASADENGRKWVERHATAELTLRFAHGYGPAAAVVQEKLEKEGFDLVSLGTHGRRGFRRFVLGSVAEATVRHSPCSVLVAHAGDL